MSNSNINNVFNSQNNFRRLTNNTPMNQDKNHNNGMPKLTNLRPLEDKDEYRSGGFRSGGVMVDQHYNSNNFLSNPFESSFPNMMSTHVGQVSNMITNYRPLDNINNVSKFNVRSNINFPNMSLSGKNIPNIPKIIAPEPIYKNIIDEDSIDTSCHLSQVVVHVIQTVLVNILDAILKTNEIVIDYQVNKKNQFDFQGRVYTNSSSEFIIKLYRLKQKDKEGNVSVVEIRKVCGDEFGYYKFEEVVLKKLGNEKILPKQLGNSSMFGAPLSMDFGSLTLDDEDDDEMNEMSDFSDNDDFISTEENDEEFDCNLCGTIVETLYSKDSYREEYMHDAYQLSTCLEKDDNRSKNMINYILKNESSKLIEGVLEPIKANKLFCAFIIVHILESIFILLSKKDIKSKLTIPKTFKTDIENIKKTWSNENGIQNNLGSVSVQFTRSQQIERRCKSILTLIQ